MDSTEAFVKLLGEEKGTYLLRETPQKELRFSVRSKANDTGDPNDTVKLVGHVMLKKDQSGFGWCTGKNDRYHTFYDIIQANKEKNSIYQFRSHYNN